jgi:hypothetical protein
VTSRRNPRAAPDPDSLRDLDPGEVNARTIAQWMAQRLEERGRLYQRDAAREISVLFGEEWVFMSWHGHLSIDTRVKRHFKRLSPFAVWDAETYSWRRRRPGDAPGRNQGEFS